MTIQRASKVRRRLSGTDLFGPAHLLPIGIDANGEDVDIDLGDHPVLAFLGPSVQGRHRAVMATSLAAGSLDYELRVFSANPDTPISPRVALRGREVVHGDWETEAAVRSLLDLIWQKLEQLREHDVATWYELTGLARVRYGPAPYLVIIDHAERVSERLLSRLIDGAADAGIFLALVAERLSPTLLGSPHLLPIYLPSSMKDDPDDMELALGPGAAADVKTSVALTEGIPLAGIGIIWNGPGQLRAFRLHNGEITWRRTRTPAR